VRVAFILFLTLLGALVSFTVTALGQGRDQAVFAFGGRYVDGYFEHALAPLVADYEDNVVLGAGYQKFLAEPLPDFHLGVEAGLALRGGQQASGEVWAGAVARYDGWTIGEQLRISPAFTFGLSAVTNSIGVEAERAADRHADPGLLFYLAPEINLSAPDNPDTELFYRVQHRSGAWGTMGDMFDGHNAQVIGLRHHF